MKSVLQKARFFISSADDVDSRKKKNAPKGVLRHLISTTIFFPPGAEDFIIWRIA